MRNGLEGDRTARTGTIIDDHRPRPRFGEALGTNARHDVVTAAGRGWDDDAYRPRRIAVRGACCVDCNACTESDHTRGDALVHCRFLLTLCIFSASVCAHAS